MNRYDYEPFKKSYGIFDRQNGMVSRGYADEPKYVAICTDVDQAQRIVDLLNASDEKRKEPR